MLGADEASTAPMPRPSQGEVHSDFLFSHTAAQKVFPKFGVKDFHHPLAPRRILTCLPLVLGFELAWARRSASDSLALLFNSLDSFRHHAYAAHCQWVKVVLRSNSALRVLRRRPEPSFEAFPG